MISSSVPVHHVDHSLCIGVAKVGGVGRAVVDHRLIDRIGGLVREDAGGQTRHHLLHVVLEGGVQDVVVDL